MKNISRLILLLIIAFSLIPSRRFNVDDCVKDPIHMYIRKIKEIDKFIYKYTILSNNYNKDQVFFMRIKDFDRIMNKTKCPLE